MAYTITQARPLLNAAELELFDQSRAEPIKALTLARLDGKVWRARTLRDKYRDLFRRQTVSVRSDPSGKSRSPVGVDNERTQRKADILQEVLGRFEARVEQLQAGEQREAAKTERVGKAAKTAHALKPQEAETKAKARVTPRSAAPVHSAAAKGAVKVAAEKPARNSTAQAGAKGGAPVGGGGVSPTLAEAASHQRATQSLKTSLEKALRASVGAHAATDLSPSVSRNSGPKKASASLAKRSLKVATAR